MLHVLFSTLFSVFGYPGETLSPMFDILHVAQKINATQSKILNPFEFRILHYKILLLTECINFTPGVGQSISPNP